MQIKRFSHVNLVMFEQLPVNFEPLEVIKILLVLQLLKSILILFTHKSSN